MESSLIIPVLNEMKSGRLVQMIESIKNQTILPSEVIFVDGFSNDGTIEYLESVSKQTNGWIRIICDYGNISTARNNGVKLASNDLLLFTDAGCVLPNNWVEEMLKPLTDYDVIVGGYEGDYVKGDKMGEAIATTIIKPLHRWKSDHLPSGRSLAIQRDVFNSVGGYPVWLDYAEDTEFDYMLKDAGFNFYVQHNAQVKWSMGGGVKLFVKKLFNYGRFDSYNPRMISRSWFAALFIFAHIFLLFHSLLMLSLFVLYAITEGVYLAYVNKRWYLLSQYIMIGWLKRYAYFAGFLYGLVVKND